MPEFMNNKHLSSFIKQNSALIDSLNISGYFHLAGASTLTQTANIKYPYHAC